MQQLKDILYNARLIEVSGDMAVEISGIAFDSRQVAAGYLFVAVQGTQVDGHDYIQQAIDKGAVAIVCKYAPVISADVALIKVDDPAVVLGITASNYYGNPSQKLQLIGVTGTNGKTTTATLLYNTYSGLGYKAGLLSTVENKIGSSVVNATHTTPDPITLNKLLAAMVSEGCSHCFMEVSSHAVVQQRIAGLIFTGAIFTNLSHDHLDYHGTFDAYIKAKKQFFDQLPSSAFALVNVDDKRGKIMLQNTKARKVTYGIKNMADHKAKVITNTFEGLELRIDEKEAWFRMVGDFNAYNILSVYAAAIENGLKSEEVLTSLSKSAPVSGRFDQIYTGSDIIAIVDYAHTPDALKNVLTTIQSIRTGNEQVITVVGCGGDRDKEKRPVMASIACQFSDKVIFTSDNPRTEDPEEIISQMKSGVSPIDFKKTLVNSDRKEAIKMAVMLAEKNDVILVAGKGHESYQEINGVKQPFDDKVILEDLLNQLS